MKVVIHKPFRVCIIPDTHFPFHHRKALEYVVTLIAKMNPTHIIQIGDLYDQYCFSKFVKANIMLPERELSFARHCGFQMWEYLSKHTKAEFYQLIGNHDVRLIKRAEERLPEAQTLVRNSLVELYKFPNVTTIEDPREELIINDICFMHGYRTKLGDHLRYNQMNTVHGHTHRGGIHFEPYNDKILWELDCGFLADQNRLPLSYTPQKKTKWTLGFGLIEEVDGMLRPQFVPLNEGGISDSDYFNKK